MNYKNILILVFICCTLSFLFFIQQPVSILENFMNDNSGNSTNVNSGNVTVNSGNSTSVNVNVPTSYFTNDGKQCTLQNNGTLLVVVTSEGTTNYTTTSTSSNISDRVFYDTNGGYAKIFTDGTHYFVEVQPYNGPLFLLSSNQPTNSTQPPSSPPSSAPGDNGGGSGSGKGIPFSTIPPGEENQYMLKSEIVPPVCPKCPDIMPASSSSTTCPPCPACARCPEPDFDCKKVPNYQTIDGNALPMPVLSDFSTFGM